MKKFMVLGIVLIALMLGTYPAFGATSAGPSSPYSWTGFYVGGHIGGSWQNSDWTWGRSKTDHNNDGFVGGIQGGFDYQWRHMVLGLGVQGTLGSLDGQSVCPNPSARCRTEPGWLVLVGPRAGFALDRTLFYVKGGATWANDKYFGNFPGASVFNEEGDSARTGWHVGAGVEYAFWKLLSVKLEYNYLGLGTDRVKFRRVNSGAFVEQADIERSGHMVTLGVNVRFNLAP